MHAEDNGLAVDFTVTTPRQTPDPAISAPLRPRGVAPQRRGAGSDRRPGAAGRGSTGRPQEGRREAPQPRRDLSGTRTPAKPSRRATGPGFARPDPSSARRPRAAISGVVPDVRRTTAPPLALVPLNVPQSRRRVKNASITKIWSTLLYPSLSANHSAQRVDNSWLASARKSPGTGLKEHPCEIAS